MSDNTFISNFFGFVQRIFNIVLSNPLIALLAGLTVAGIIISIIVGLVKK